MMRQSQRSALLLSCCLAVVACAGRGGSVSSSGGGGTGQTGTGNGSGTGNGTGSGGGTGGIAAGGVDAGAPPVQPAASGLDLFNNTALCQSGQVSVGPSPVRRLSRVEYNNMVRDLGLDPGNTQPANQFVSEQKIGGNFNTNSYAQVSGTLINQQYLQAAETLAAAAVSASNLTTLVSCASTPGTACATQFIADFANRAFRGQLDATESAALLALYTTVSTQFDFPTGIEAVIESVLTSPRFLYVLEFGQPAAGASAAAVPLAPMELATRLALYLWRSIPDATLTTAATTGHLVTATDVATQATRMLADPKAKGALQDFANQWLDIENMDAVTKDTVFKTWGASLAQELHLESLATFSNAVTTDNTDLTTLLTQTTSYVNADLNTFYNSPASYGLNSSGPGTITDYHKTAIASPHMGILTDGAVLAQHAHTTLPSPTLRGRMIRQQILCEQVPEPPASVGGKPIPPPPTSAAGTTTRALYLLHVANGATTGTNGATSNPCNACHQYMDWIGFGFDDFDATGAYITTEGGTTATNGTAVDSSGKLIQMTASDISGTFTGTTDLITQLAASPQVDQCFALEQMRYALGRVESDADACSAQQIYQAFSSAPTKFNLQKLLVAVVSSNSFMYRTPVVAGGACQ